MSVEFFQTRIGRQFYEGTMPDLVNQLARLNRLLERLVAAHERDGRRSDDAEA